MTYLPAYISNLYLITGLSILLAYITANRVFPVIWNIVTTNNELNVKCSLIA